MCFLAWPDLAGWIAGARAESAKIQLLTELDIGRTTDMASMPEDAKRMVVE